MSPGSISRDLTIILLLGLVLIGSGMGLRDAWPSDEPRFALIAKEMAETGDWLFPRRGGELYPDKPPLFMWAQAIAFQLTGSLRVGMLLPSLLSGLLVLILVYDAGRRLWDQDVARMAALLLMVTPQFVLEARAGQLDAMVTAWIALGMYGFLRHLLLGPDRRWLWIGFAACGFGIITKGVGFLPLLAFLPFLLYRLRGDRTVAFRAAAMDALVGTVLMLAAIGTWLLPMLIAVEQANDPAYSAYRDNILFTQTGERYLMPSHHHKPWWYFLVEVIPALWLPVFLLLPWLLPCWWRRLRENDGRQVILLGFVLLTVAFFSISPGKRGVYVLPALPWACLAAAPFLTDLLDRRGVRRLALITSALMGGLMTLAAAYLTWVAPEMAAELVERYRFEPSGPLWLAGLAALAATLIIGVAGRRPPLAYGAVMLVMWMVLGLWVYPALDATKSGRGLLEELERQLPADRPLAVVDWKEQTLLQAQRPVQNFGFRVPVEQQTAAALDWLKAHPRGAILVQGRSLAPCFTAGTPRLLGVAHRREWYLVDQDNVAPGCRLATAD